MVGIVPQWEAGGFIKILVFPKEFQGFLVSEALQVGVYVGPRLVMDFGPILGGFWEAKMRPRRPKMALRRASTEPRRPHDGARPAPRRSKDVLRCIQDGFRFENVKI